MATAKRRNYSCDFETTTDPLDCRVWSAGAIEIDGEFKNYQDWNNIDDFMKWAQKTCGNLYFHNLRFDGEFIVNWLLHNGYTYSREQKPMTFDCIISNMGQWYQLNIYYGKLSSGRMKKTTIYDSLKKLPFTVKAIAKSFGLPIEKGDIDYHLYRPVGHVITDDERKYLRNDVEIVARALWIQMEENKLNKMTVGSDALEGFKNSLHESPKISKRLFGHLFPVFNREMDEELRGAYKGGFTWVNPKFQGQAVGQGMVFDVNSLYPAMMYQKLLPYSDPIPYNGEYIQDEEYPLYLQKISFSFELKDGHIPTIQLKSTPGYRENEYLTTSNGEVIDFTLTNVDLQLIKEHYNIDDEFYHMGWKFKGKIGMFKTYIDFWTDKKINAKDPSERQLAKLMLNSLYGKFASNPKVTGKYPELKEDGSTRFVLHKEDEFKDPVYTPMGCFITAYAREMTIRTAQSVYDRILYCDTDSIHILGTEIPKAIEHMIHPKNLGMWAHESCFNRAKFVRQKTYVEDVCQKYNAEKDEWEECSHEEMERTHLDVKCAGMPESVKQYVTFENFEIGFTHIGNERTRKEGEELIQGKKRPKHVKGGQVLEDVVFTIK